MRNMIGILCLGGLLAASSAFMLGCVSMEFASQGAKINDPISADYYWVCLWFNCWWWWSDNPTENCRIPDDHAKNMGGRYVYRPGYREVKISYSWWTIFPAFATLGAVTPLKIICYETRSSDTVATDEEAVELK